MCCSMLFGFVVGVLAFKVLRCVGWFFGRGRAGCANHRCCGAAGHRSGYTRSENGSVAGRLSIDGILPGLELNERQHVEAAPIFALLSERLGGRGPRIEIALSILAKERFDAAPLADELLGLSPGEQRRILDGLEHLHTILIAEQREYLNKELEKR